MEWIMDQIMRYNPALQSSWAVLFFGAVYHAVQVDSNYRAFE